jgi:hypothetical protein
MPFHDEQGWQAEILSTGEQDCIIFLRSLGGPRESGRLTVPEFSPNGAAMYEESGFP